MKTSAAIGCVVRGPTITRNLSNRKELFKSIEKFQKKFSDKNNITRPNYWSGWNLKPLEIEFWLQVDDRLHERLKYKKKNEIWNKFLLNP